MSKPRLLDLFCGAGGSAVGYHRAGFDVVGVDVAPQPHFPFEFHQADALEVLSTDFPLYFDAIHASPPCQAYTTANAKDKGRGGRADSHPRLLEPVRQLLLGETKPWVIENVEGAARVFAPTLRLTGRMFGLGVWRPRLFESNVLILAPRAGKPSGQIIGVYGDRPDGRYLQSKTKDHPLRNRAAKGLAEGADAMGIDWMDWRELCEAIPPAYTEYIGAQLLAAVLAERDSAG